MEKENLLRKIEGKVRAIKDDIIDWRRYFHKYPELGFQEYKTSTKVRSILKNLKIPFEIKAETGVVGYIDRKAKITVGLRADMDGLPVEEKTGLPFASVHKGVMHACGHDGHMATLLGVAGILKKMESYLNVNVKLIFQPCEESPPGGAPLMIKEGVLKDIDYLVGFHFFPQLPLYKIWIGKGPVMANTDYFKIIVKGKGGHASSPHLLKDPVVCAASFITGLQTIVSRTIDPLQPAVISVCQIKGGDAFNVIPGEVELTGTIRTLDEDVRKKIVDEMERKSRTIAESFGCTADFQYKNYSPACVNDKELSEKLHGIAKTVIDERNLIEYHPVMGGEDFAFFSQKVPSSYIFVGVGEKSGVHHNSKFSIDEKILPYSVHFFSSLILLFPSSQW